MNAIATRPWPWAAAWRAVRIAYLRWELRGNERYLQTLITGGIVTMHELCIWQARIAADRKHLARVEAS